MRIQQFITARAFGFKGNSNKQIRSQVETCGGEKGLDADNLLDVDGNGAIELADVIYMLNVFVDNFFLIDVRTKAPQGELYAPDCVFRVEVALTNKDGTPPPAAARVLLDFAHPGALSETKWVVSCPT